MGKDEEEGAVATTMLVVDVEDVGELVFFSVVGEDVGVVLSFFTATLTRVDSLSILQSELESLLPLSIESP